MKILIIPDVHGRDFWIEPCSHLTDYDRVVFLGDYHDPYSFQVSKEVSRHRLRDELVPFIEENRDKVICLFGNHDGNYLVGDMADRIDYHHKQEIRELLERINPQLVYQVDGYLFSHSGVLPEWVEDWELNFNDLNSLSFDDPSLRAVSPYRGGWNSAGSCVWGDVREYANSKHFPDLYQIFGHTQLQDAYIDEDFACLDCRKAFVLDTETKQLKPYEYVSKINESTGCTEDN